MRKIVCLFFLVLIMGCGAPAEFRKAQESFNQNNYIEALRYYEIALTKAKSQEDRRNIQQDIENTKKKIVDNSLNEAEKAYSRQQPPNAQSIDDALSILKEISSYDDEQRRISERIKKYRQERGQIALSVKNLISDADEMIKKGEYYSALDKLRKAQAKDADKQLSDKIKSLQNESETKKKQYLEQINKNLDAGNGEAADAAYQKLVMIDPNLLEIKELKKKIQDKQREQVLADMNVFNAQKKWFKAYTLLKNSKADGLEEDLAKISAAAVEYYSKKAESSFEAGRMHQAYISSLKAREFDSSDINIQRIYKKSEDHLVKEIQKYIAVPTFNSPSNDPDAGKLFSDALISRLIKILPYGINIVEREKIDLLINEKKMELKNIGNLLGVDMIITGNVSRFKIDLNSSERMITTKIKIGEEEKPNPEYTQLLNTYGKNLKDWPRIPSATIKEDKFEIVKYKKGQITSKAFADVSIRIFDSEKATIVDAQDFQDSTEVSDAFQEGIEGTNIQEDPLNLPGDTEIKRGLQNKILDKIVSKISEIFEKREKRFLKSVSFHIDRKEYVEAIKFAANGYVYCKNARIDNEQCQKAYSLMIDLTEGE